MHEHFTNDQLFAALGTGLGMGIVAFFVLFFVVILVVTVFYFLLLQKTMNRVSEFNRPFPGGLIWLGFIPLVNIIWIPVFQIMLSVAIKKDFLAAGRVDHDNGALNLAIAQAVCLALFWVPVVNAITGIAHFILWIIYWAKISSIKDKMPVQTLIISAPIYPPRQ